MSFIACGAGLFILITLVSIAICLKGETRIWHTYFRSIQKVRIADLTAKKSLVLLFYIIVDLGLEVAHSLP